MIVKSTKVGDTLETQIGPLVVQDSKLYINPGGPFVRYLLRDCLEALVEDMRQRIENKLDNVVLVEGGEGSGKSNLGWWICKLFDPDHDPSDHLIYSMKQLKARLRRDSRPGQVFWLDELYEIASNRTWNSTETKDFINLLVRMRNRGWTFILCIPRVKDSDEYIKNHRSTHDIMCEAQDFDHSMYLMRGYAGLWKRKINGEMQHVGYLKYPAIPEEAAERYESAKNGDQDELLGAPEEESGNSYRKKYEGQTVKLSAAVLMLKDVGVSRQEICDRLKISERTYYHMCSAAKNGTPEVIDDDSEE